jgi:hypothetical protein
MITKIQMFTDILHSDVWQHKIVSPVRYKTKTWFKSFPHIVDIIPGTCGVTKIGYWKK